MATSWTAKLKSFKKDCINWCPSKRWQFEQQDVELSYSKHGPVLGEKNGKCLCCKNCRS
jgi:hypothetical protein